MIKYFQDISDPSTPCSFTLTDAATPVVERTAMLEFTPSMMLILISSSTSSQDWSTDCDPQCVPVLLFKWSRNLSENAAGALWWSYLATAPSPVENDKNCTFYFYLDITSRHFQINVAPTPDLGLFVMNQIKTLVYFDIEATGLKSSGRPRITELSLVAVNLQDVLGEFHSSPNS